MAASKQLLTALVRLRASPDFQVVLDHMKEELEAADKYNRKSTGEPLYRSQGKAIFLDEFLERFANARASVDKMRT